MRYVSTRNTAVQADFEQVVLSGIADDGGLFVPLALPLFAPQDIANWSTLPYAELAYRIIRPFVGAAIAETDLKRLLNAASSRFQHRAVAPLHQVDRNEWVLELFHGPTCSSKDFAAQLQAQLVQHFLQQRGRRAVLLGATNGDTGLAAIEAFKHSAEAHVVALYPERGVPPHQLQALLAVAQPNVHLFAVDGSFDECQGIVSGLFKQWPCAPYAAISFNSSNWVNVLAQLVVYFHAVLQLGGGQRPIGFSVPAASFAEVYAGYIAQKMGLPITQLIVATNTNDALHQLFLKNHYSRLRANKTLSPAMDLSTFSNLERFLWEVYEHDADAVRALMDGLESSGEMTIANDCWLRARVIIDSYAVSDEETLNEIIALHRDTGYIVDPHTATGVIAARLYRRSLVAPMVTLGEISPVKSAALLDELGISVPRPACRSAQHNGPAHQRIRPDNIALLLQQLDAL
ncbi:MULTISPECIES: threonine synthase [Pseudomonas]|jgi:threonine synthase|uniref:Threonine synthase n=2 Tax=Pseudomonas TaxID=286 RepID=A0A4Y9T879_PSEFL|nr:MULTISPECIES: threonine synthase [Pseudomonas]CRM88026.1 Threonine synthase [Pseudomonas sp. 22 E 5]MCX9151679.1 threonine synthase [Pseudomonas sp. TB1-B1]QXH69615.1 threonine synthase [Pseudomonas asgharzadehiana]TFW40583.1 threonine synthase [Pseudomonas fluorescens]TKJ61115.1 threonine synthase [Pseudomonas sp. CFBP13506]